MAATAASISGITTNDAESKGAFPEKTEADTGNIYNTTAVIAAAVIPCRSLPRIYGLRLRPEPEVTAMTCK
jgi:hypothetical protein